MVDELFAKILIHRSEKEFASIRRESKQTGVKHIGEVLTTLIAERRKESFVQISQGLSITLTVYHRNIVYYNPSRKFNNDLERLADVFSLCSVSFPQSNRLIQE